MELNNIDVGENMMVNIHTIDKLMEYKEGWDALMLRFRYYQQRLIQGQILTYSTDKFMMKAMGWGNRKLAKIKSILLKYWMIDVVMKKEWNKIAGWYVKVNYTFNPETVRKHTVVYEMDQKEDEESQIWRIYNLKNLQNALQIQPNNINKIQSNLKENIYSPKKNFSDLNSNLQVVVEK